MLPQDNGYLTKGAERCRSEVTRTLRSSFEEFPGLKRAPLASKTRPVRHADALRPQRASSRRRWSTSRSAKISGANGTRTLSSATRERERPQLAESPAQRRIFRCVDTRIRDTRIRPRRGRTRPRDHPGEHQSPRKRTDDHRAQFPGQDQREYRQLGDRFVDRGRGREDALVDAVGRRHGDGPLDGQEHSRDARMDLAQFARADRHRSDLSGARKSERQGRRPDVGNLSRHADRTGRAGRRLFHDPRRRASAVHSADRKTHDRHRQPRRLDHGEMVPRTSRGKLSLHTVSRDLRDHADV